MFVYYVCNIYFMLNFRMLIISSLLCALGISFLQDDSDLMKLIFELSSFY